jgi:hypothetical protein
MTIENIALRTRDSRECESSFDCECSQTLCWEKRRLAQLFSLASSMKMLTVSCFTTTLGLIAGISQESKHLNDTLEYDVLKGQYFESSAQQT